MSAVITLAYRGCLISYLRYISRLIARARERNIFESKCLRSGIAPITRAWERGDKAREAATITRNPCNRSREFR